MARIEGLPTDYTSLLWAAQAGDPRAAMAAMFVRPDPYGMTFGPVGQPGYGVSGLGGRRRIVIGHIDDVGSAGAALASSSDSVDGWDGVGDFGMPGWSVMQQYQRLPGGSSYGSPAYGGPGAFSQVYGPAFMLLPPNTMREGFAPPGYARGRGFRKDPLKNILGY